MPPYSNIAHNNLISIYFDWFQVYLFGYFETKHFYCEKSPVTFSLCIPICLQMNLLRAA